MQPTDRPEFVAILNGLAAVKPGAKLTPEALDLWWLAMAEWPLADFKAAASQLARTVEFFPNPFHFHQLRKTAIEQTAGDAWAQVLAAIRTMNPGQSVSLGQRIDRAVRNIGGYMHLCCMTSKDLEWRQKRFEEEFTKLADVDEAQAVLPHLAATRLLADTKRLT